MRHEKWFNKNGVLFEKREGEFSKLVAELIPVFRKFEDRITYRDLYDVAKDAALTAVGNLVAQSVVEEENRRDNVAKRKKAKAPRRA